MFEEAIDFIAARLEKHPDAFVYHYANYEESALKRLAMSCYYASPETYKGIGYPGPPQIDPGKP